MSVKLDQNSIELLESLYNDFSDKMVKLINSVNLSTGLVIRITQGFRTLDEQQQLYNQGRVSRGRLVTHALPFQSFHNYGLAADICFRGIDPYLSFNTDGENIWRKVGLIGESIGLTWGGRFHGEKEDKPHFELSYGLFWENCQSMCEDDGLAHLWNFIDKQRGVALGYGWNKIPALHKL